MTPLHGRIAYFSFQSGKPAHGSRVEEITHAHISKSARCFARTRPRTSDNGHVPPLSLNHHQTTEGAGCDQKWKCRRSREMAQGRGGNVERTETER
ncbi:uncharacterized protein P884DRAFT_259770 [Thermothelomyces heterothallicus CBS 202.75]|uniref:uncharacterized protein n=1 Tax=Thermothelomyces heterothallicus CBS 202.75 TaxID=1149848 RepID=UPI003743634F